MSQDNASPRPALFRVKEFAREHAISEAKTWEMIARGELLAVKIGSATRIRAVDAVDFRCLQNRLRTDLDGTQRRGRIGRKVRVPRASSEDDDAATTSSFAVLAGSEGDNAGTTYFPAISSASE